jgi:uncharacterized iron-regulated protein
MILGILIVALLALSPPDGIIHHGVDTVSSEEMISMLEEVPVVFIGEKHDDALAHEWELFIWTNLAFDEKSLALEMFETDVQELLDGYLAGELNLDEFLESARPWNNYMEAYHPMVEHAAQNGMNVIAANVPRHFAATVARNGWEGLREAENSDFFENISVDSTNDSYRQQFLGTMEAIGNQMQAMPMDPVNMYRAQLLKDAVMASSIEGISCVFICGSFHSDYRSGIPDQLEPEVSYLTVSVVGEDEPWEAEQADFVIVCGI